MASIVTTWLSTKCFRTNRHRRTVATTNIRKVQMTKLFLRLSRVGMLAGILTVFCATALAHDPGLSAAEIRILPDRIVAEISFAPTDLEGIQQLDSKLLALENNQHQLTLLRFGLKSSDRNSVHYLLEFASSNAGELRISAPVLASLRRGHKQFCTVFDQENR